MTIEGGLAASRPGASSSGDTATDPEARRSVLIVDDQDDERAIQRTMLEFLGYRVTEASDGETALDLALDLRPTLVLLDIAMPRMDGLTVCRRLRSDPRTASTVVLFYTASPAGEADQRVREAGGDGVLVKPVDPHTVASQVRAMIGPPVG